MALTDIVEGFPVWARMLLLALIVVVAIPSALYFGEVVAPAVTDALRKGRPVTLGPVSFGEYENPAIRECKLRLENTNDTLNALRSQLTVLADLAKSQDADVLKLVEEKNSFVKMTQEEQKNQYYPTDYISANLQASIDNAARARDSTMNDMIGVVNQSVVYVDKLGDFCFDFIRNHDGQTAHRN